ncbi:hypothetical protein [Thalassobacillus devorans]|uniref:hypothetical protein n=1 Tax=Thalassobacillus devorans TaxID=279813 RepID=UPI00048D7FE9|nr:hypothetical protein [Thalassobacillus devorans]
MSKAETKSSGGAGAIGSVILGSFIVGTLLADKKKVGGSHSKQKSPRVLSSAKQKYKLKKDELYLAGLKRDERIQRQKNRLQSEARKRAIKEATLHKETQSG